MMKGDDMSYTAMISLRRFGVVSFVGLVARSVIDLAEIIAMRL